MDVTDLEDSLYDVTPETSVKAPLIKQYLDMILYSEAHGIVVEESSMLGSTKSFYAAALMIAEDKKLPKFFTNPLTFGSEISRQKTALLSLGWRRAKVKRVNGVDYYRYSRIKQE